MQSSQQDEKGGWLEFMYKQRNNQDLYLKNNEYSQLGYDEVRYVEDESQSSLPSIETNYYSMDNQNISQQTHPDTPERYQSLNERRRTLPSSNSLIPSRNGW